MDSKLRNIESEGAIFRNTLRETTCELERSRAEMDAARDVTREARQRSASTDMQLRQTKREGTLLRATVMSLEARIDQTKATDSQNQKLATMEMEHEKLHQTVAELRRQATQQPERTSTAPEATDSLPRVSRKLNRLQRCRHDGASTERVPWERLSGRLRSNGKVLFHYRTFYTAVKSLPQQSSHTVDMLFPEYRGVQP